MSAWMTIEEEAGTSRFAPHSHNGYHAGSFAPAEHDGAGRRAPGDERLAMHEVVLVTGDRLRLW